MNRHRHMTLMTLNQNLFINQNFKGFSKKILYEKKILCCYLYYIGQFNFITGNTSSSKERIQMYRFNDTNFVRTLYPKKHSLYEHYITFTALSIYYNLRILSSPAVDKV